MQTVHNIFSAISRNHYTLDALLAQRGFPVFNHGLTFCIFLINLIHRFVLLFLKKSGESFIYRAE